MSDEYIALVASGQAFSVLAAIKNGLMHEATTEIVREDASSIAFRMRSHPKRNDWPEDARISLYSDNAILLSIDVSNERNDIVFLVKNLGASKGINLTFNEE